MTVAPPFDATLRDRLRALAESAQPENPGAWANEQRLGPLLHRLDPDPIETVRTGDVLEVDPASGTVRVWHS